jgi:phosphoglycerate dehydrogenase-like enzyme
MSNIPLSYFRHGRHNYISVIYSRSQRPLLPQSDGAIRAAGLDVVDPEPPTDPAALASVPGLLVTPHVAFYSEEALQESQRKATTQVIKALRGEPLDYQVN